MQEVGGTSCRFVLLSLALLQAAVGSEVPARFMLASSPSEQNVYISAFPELREYAKPLEQRATVDLQVLIDGKASKCQGADCTEDSDMGLQSPQGLALHHGSEKAVLYVADPAAENVYSYRLLVEDTAMVSTSSVKVGAQRRVLEGVVGVYGVAVDGFGNLYFTTNQGQVGKVSCEQLQQSKPTPTYLYTSSSNSITVSSPFGISADSFFVYWTNQESGQSAGAVVRALEKSNDEMQQQYPQYPQPLAQNSDKSYGVCLVNDNVFFTGEAQFLYGTKKSGGSIAEVYHSFKKPRGCSYDGQNSMFVADLEDNAIYMLPANVETPRLVKKVWKAFNVPAPMSLAVFTGSPRYSEERVDKGFLGLGW